MILVRGNGKGGVGKSATAQNLAVYLRQNYSDMSVVLVDADSHQGTTTDWLEERNSLDNASDLVDIEFRQVHSRSDKSAAYKMLLSLNEQFDIVIVDTQGADTVTSRAVFSACDILVVPVRPKRRDLKALMGFGEVAGFLEVVEKAKASNPDLIVCSIITQAPSHPNQKYRIDNAREVLASAELNPLESCTQNRNAWDDSDEGGRSVLEWTDKAAKNEAQAVFGELLAYIETFTSKPAKEA